VVVPVLTEDGQGDPPVASEITLAESAFLRREEESGAAKPQVPSGNCARRTVGQQASDDRGPRFAQKSLDVLGRGSARHARGVLRRKDVGATPEDVIRLSPHPTLSC
jgi:hypothetical protein